MTNIPFNNARGAASSLQMEPPFAFSDVTMSVFPLRASLPSLENFCRNYLNQAPDLVQFRPFVPFVYLVILDYGRMSLEAANMGWVSQREVAFGIPLRWLNAREDGLDFHDWAFSSPFIFVDNELSMSTGREVYGWPKLLARLDPSVSEWVQNPHGARRVFQVSTKGTSEAYAGQTSAYRPLLSVFQHRTAGILDMPPSLDAIVKPLSQMSNTATSLTRLGADLAKTFVGMASDRITGSSVLPDMAEMDRFRAQLSPDKSRQWRSVQDWLPGVKDALWSLFPRMYANTINFKQFRDAGNPHATCYQALTAARMPVKSFKQGGFLGPQNMLLGQMDGGFRIDIHHLAGLPIIESLGLEVSEERLMGDTRVSTLTPVAPLWMKVDMTYGLADTLIWQGRTDTWNEGPALTHAKAVTENRRASKSVITEKVVQKREDSAEQTEETPDTGALTMEEDAQAGDDGQGFNYIRAMNSFNTARGASEAVGGSFNIPDASVRVLPLKADHATLQTFVRNYLRIEKKMRFEAWGDFVYLVISDFKQMNSEMSALSKRRARELTLLVPVKCYDWFKDGDYAEGGDPDDRGTAAELRAERGKQKLLTTGFVNAFSFVDDVQTAITGNEVFGVPSMGSTIAASENEWLSRDLSKERSQHEILNMKAQVLPELMAGAQAVDRTLVDVSTHHPHHPLVQESEAEAINKWVGLLADDLECKIGEAGSEATQSGLGFALKLLGGSLPFNQFSLKQFRDSHETRNACYQGLVLRRHTIDKLTDFREIEAPIHVAITDYPTQPITQILGLKPKFTYPGRDRLIRVFEAIRPFSLNGDLERGAGATLFERVNTEKWQRVTCTEEMFGWRRLKGDDIAAYIDRLDDTMSCELIYEFYNPENETTVEKHLPRASARFLRSWYDKRVKTGLTSNVMVRLRELDGMVSCLTEQEDFDAFDRQKTVDLAAWNDQMAHREVKVSQSAAAQKLESFSPATVIDKVLSRRWGISSTAGQSHFRKSDYCLPVSSVPSTFADALFPDLERLDGYWPESKEHAEHQSSQRTSAFAAFKLELDTAIHTFALLYPSVLYREPPKEGESWTFDAMITALSESLNHFLDGEKAQQAKEHTGTLVEEVKGKEDVAVLMKATESLVTHFFQAHLPEIFGLVPTAETKLHLGNMAYHIEEPTLKDWYKARKGFRAMSEIIRQNFGDDEDTDDVIDQFITPFIERTENHIAALEKNENGADMTLASQREAVPDLLRKRLHEAVTGQKIKA